MFRFAEKNAESVNYVRFEVECKIWISINTRGLFYN